MRNTFAHGAQNRVHAAAVSQLLDPSEETIERTLRTFPAHAELVCSLHVTLIHSAPDERVPLPKVPG